VKPGDRPQASNSFVDDPATESPAGEFSSTFRTAVYGPVRTVV